jgi:hypothetical protein
VRLPPDLTALDLDGEEVNLLGLVKRRPVLFVFLRHYG